METRQKITEDMKQQVLETQNMIEQAGLFPGAKLNRRQRRAIEKQNRRLRWRQVNKIKKC